MPALTLANLLSLTTKALGNRLDLTASELSLQANIAQQEIAAMLPHTELMKSSTLVLAAGSNSTVVPGDLAEVISVSRPNSYDSMGYRILTQVPLREIDNASEGTQTGVANRYAISANSILMYPTSTSQDTFTLRYVASPTDMVALTTQPSLHTRYQPAVLYKLQENMADLMVDNERAAYFRNKCISVLGTVPTPQESLSRAQGAT